MRKVILRKHLFDINQLIKEIITSWGDAFLPGEVILDLEETPLNTYVDKDAIEEVLNKLLNNVVTYSPPKGKITISTQKEEGLIKVGIEDEGVGIPPEHITRIFEIFYRCDSPLTKKYSGTGIGFTIAKNIIEKHGGKIWVENKREKENKIYFTLYPEWKNR